MTPEKKRIVDKFMELYTDLDRVGDDIAQSAEEGKAADMAENADNSVYYYDRMDVETEKAGKLIRELQDTINSIVAGFLNDEEMNEVEGMY